MNVGLAELEAFAAVARHRSFRAAARERSASASTISLAVRTLEDRLGVRLFNRTTRTVTLTEAGSRLFARLAPAFGEIAAAVADVEGPGTGTGGTLRLNVPTAVARLVIAPMLGRFHAANPRLRIEIVEDNNFIDVVAEGFDGGARYGESLALDMVAVPMGPPQRFAVACSRAFLDRHGLPTSPQDLLARPGIRFRFASGAIPPWEFEKDGRNLKLTPNGPLVATSADTAIAAAEDGVGLFYTIEGFLRPSISAGRLVEVLADWSVAFPGPFLYFPSGRLMPPALDAFVKFLRAERRNARGAW